MKEDKSCQKQREVDQIETRLDVTAVLTTYIPYAWTYGYAGGLVRVLDRWSSYIISIPDSTASSTE